MLKNWEFGKCEKERSFQKEGAALQRHEFTIGLLGEWGLARSSEGWEPSVWRTQLGER